MRFGNFDIPVRAHFWKIFGMYHASFCLVNPVWAKLTLFGVNTVNWKRRLCMAKNMLYMLICLIAILSKNFANGSLMIKSISYGRRLLTL